MKVFVELTDFAVNATGKELRARVRQLEDLGATGVSISDHLFVNPTTPGGSILLSCDPLTTLAAVAGISDTLELQTTVVNSQWINPALLFRQFCQLAVFAGGKKVAAGLGTGWNSEEFAAIGEPMPPFGQRMSRLEETFRIGRQLFDQGTATVNGEFVSVKNLPMSPSPAVPPRLLAGGGSRRILEIAGRYCDVVDLHGAPGKYGALKGRTLMEKHDASLRTIIQTTVDDTVEQVETVRSASLEGGRPADAVEIGMQFQHVIFTSSVSEVRDVEERLCREWGKVDYRPLDQIPAILIGDPRRMSDLLAERRDRFGLSRVIIKDYDPYSNDKEDQIRFLAEVLPLLN